MIARALHKVVMGQAAFAVVVTLLLSVGAVRSAPTVHTVITTECSKYFTWQTLGMFYSHRKAGMPGPITRIMCCTPEEYERLPEADRDLVPTHVAPSYTVHPRTGDVYSAYNKPVAVIDWLSKNDVKEDYVLIIDADMIMREPFLPEEVGSKPGRAISAYFGYMKGVNNELALKHVPEVLPRNDTLAGPKGRRGDMVGGFTLMHREDLRKVAPLWLKYTEDVRFDPDAWTLSGDAYSVHKGDKPWISEMYGYSFGAAKADVWHVCHHTAMLYPGYEVTEPPKVLHYGLLWNVEGASPYSFDKHRHYDFDPLACPPWDIPTDPAKSKRGLFTHPPRPSSFKTTGSQLLRDLLAIEVIVTLNEAFCERHRKHCPPSDELERECKKADEIAAELDEAYSKLELPDPCRNHDSRCNQWAAANECANNPGFMYDHCMLACHLCKPRDRRTRVATVKERQRAAMQGGGALDTAHRDEITKKKVEAVEAHAAGGKKGAGSLVGGGADKLRGGLQEQQQEGEGGQGWGALAGEEAGAGAGDGSKTGEALIKRLQRKCTAHAEWTVEQIKLCLSRADQGLAYDPASDGSAGVGLGDGNDLDGTGLGLEGQEEQLPMDDLDPQLQQRGQHAGAVGGLRPHRAGGRGKAHRGAKSRLSHVAHLKSKVTSDLHDAGRLLGDGVQRTKRLAVKGIQQSEQAVGRLGWGGVVLWAMVLVGLLFGIPYVRNARTGGGFISSGTNGGGGRTRFKTARSD